MADDKTPKVVYVAYSTLNTALDILREGIPPKIDRSVFQNQSGGTQAQLMSAFKALGFIKETGEPNRPLLDHLVNKDTRKNAMRAVLEDKYADFVTLAQQHGTEQQYMDRFREMGVTGETLQKAMTFFQMAATDVGLPLSTHVTRKTKFGPNDGTPRRTRKPRQRRNREDENGDENTSGNASGSTTTIDLHSGGSASLTLDVDLITLSDEDRDWVVGAVKYFRNYQTKEKAQA
jgi:hypothetical protein